MTTALTTLGDLPALPLDALADLPALPLDALADLPALPLDALADLAAAAGYEDRGDRAAAELYLGFALSKLGHNVVAPAAVARLLQAFYTLARGTARRNVGNRI